MGDGSSFYESALTSEQIRWQREYEYNTDYYIGWLIQSAIDAYMVGKGWTLRGSSESATEYLQITTDAQGKGVNVQTQTTCSRPWRNGGGGGEVRTTTFHNGSKFSTGEEPDISFAAVRSAIHGLVDRFDDCPRPSDSADIATLYSAIAGHLTPAPGGTLTPKIGLIKEAAVVLTGNTAEAYKDEFLWAIETVLDGYCSFATLIAHFMAGQSGLWAGVRANYIGMLIKGREAFDAVAQRGPTECDFSALVTVGKIAFDVANVFAPKPLESAAELTLIGIGLVSDGLDKGEAVSHPQTYGEVLDDVLKIGLDSIGNQIRDLEEQMATNVRVDMRNISNSDPTIRSIWQLPTPGSLDLSDEPDIATDQQAVRNIRSHMKSMVGALDSYIQNGRDSDAGICDSVRRFSFLGIGPSGPGGVLQELNDMFCDLLGGLRNQIDLSADNLYAACMVLLSTDQEYADLLATTAAGLESLDSPDGYADPWRYSEYPKMSRTDTSQSIKDMWRMFLPAPVPQAPTQPPRVAPLGAEPTDLQEVVPKFEK